jgi:hypothetical protein
MRVPDELRECVCFAQPVWPSGPGGRATAFFIGVPFGVEGQRYAYAVTAKHCITGGEETRRQHGNRPATKAILWVNHREHGRLSEKTLVSDWLLHDTADLGVYPLGAMNRAYQIKVWDAEQGLASEPVVREKNIGAGDDVFITGLLTHHWGDTRNLPIVRLGS